jgi:hypothetical protein
MIRFSTVELMDEQKCYDYVVEILHPGGLCCPECKSPVEQSKVPRRDRAPILYFRCSCVRDYNAFSGTGLCTRDTDLASGQGIGY